MLLRPTVPIPLDWKAVVKSVDCLALPLIKRRAKTVIFTYTISRNNSRNQVRVQGDVSLEFTTRSVVRQDCTIAGWY